MTGVSGTIGDGYVFPFTPNNDANYSVDEIGGLLRRVAFTSDGGFSRTIAYGCATYQTIASTPILGGMEDTAENSKADLMGTYLGYLLKIDGMVRGIVTDINTGDPVENATVSVGDYDGVTNSYGLCAIEVPPGSYTVSCTHPDYYNYVHPTDVVVDYNETCWVDIDLSPLFSVDEIEQGDRIARIYPNPCAAHISIEYFMKSSGNVDIAVYNIKGQKVCTLVNEIQEIGYHEVTFDNFDTGNAKLSSGIYFIKLHTEQDTNIEKFLIIE
ncbi:MAG: T9SS type A sorting domain-containing protein [Candidatus Celaenobacter polaris]|nr:T9SS type A sorting domain-containing protein [Candidatus Celaenobacter polaris]